MLPFKNVSYFVIYICISYVIFSALKAYDAPEKSSQECIYEIGVALVFKLAHQHIHFIKTKLVLECAIYWPE